MIEIKIIDNFTPVLDNVINSLVSHIISSLNNVAHIIENQTQDKVPFRRGDLEHSFSWNIHDNSDFVELEVGYSSIAPDNYDYAYAQHEIEYNHPIKGQSHYLIDGIRDSSNEFFVLLEKDFLSLFN